MQSTLNLKPDDPHDVLVLERDVVEALAGRETCKPVHEAKIGPPAHQREPVAPEFAAAPSVPPVDTSFRATAAHTAANRLEAPSGPPSVGRRAVRSSAGLAVAGCIGVAGVVWQAYGEAARQLVATWVPHFVSTASPPDNAASVARQSAKPAAEASTITPAPAQAAPLGQTSTADVASTAAAAPPLLQSVARDLANVSQQVEQMKASIAELKANQDQMSRDVAKGSEKALEQSPRPRMSAPLTSAAAPPRPPAAPTRRLARPARPAQAAAAAPLPPPPAPYVPPQAAARYAPPPAGAPYVPRQVEQLPQAAVPPPDPNVPRPPMSIGARLPGLD